MIQGTRNVSGNTLAYLKDGTGPAVVIVHGVGGHKEDWKAVVEQLGKSHTVYAIDMLGFGGSSRNAPELGMAAQADALKGLLDQEGITTADLIGNSVGGWVTATFAATDPDRVGKLVIVDPAGFEAMFQGEPPVNLFPDDVGQMEKLLSFVLHSDFAHTRAFAEQAFTAFTASGEKTIVPRLWPGLTNSPRLETLLPKIKAPTLVIWGKEDKLFPVTLAPYITGLTPGATSVLIDNASHFAHIDQPAAFISAVSEFLGSSNTRVAAQLDANKQFVIRHFDDFVNKKDLDAIDRNMTADFLDHDGPGGKRIDRAGDKAMMAAMHTAFPDLKVAVQEALAEGDKVMVRNIWTATDPKTGKRMEFHGFVLWRIRNGKIVERWATVTPLHELATANLAW
jgi:triacylglycerol lipase